jgi:hypothetical protein
MSFTLALMGLALHVLIWGNILTGETGLIG